MATLGGMTTLGGMGGSGGKGPLPPKFPSSGGLASMDSNYPKVMEFFGWILFNQ